MKRLLRYVRRWLLFWLLPVLPLDALVRAPVRYLRYMRAWRTYQALSPQTPLKFLASYPRLDDDTASTGFDAHYLYQAVWAMQRISQSQPSAHVDVGSDVKYATMLSTHQPVWFIDIRPLNVHLAHFHSVAGNVLQLPFGDQSLSSLSCLHVIEHIGLGRYRDMLDPQGTRKACAELARVLAPGGSLLLSTPVGMSTVYFNAHRVHTPAEIISFFPPDITLREFSAVADDGALLLNADVHQLASAHYACGLFWFQRVSR